MVDGTPLTTVEQVHEEGSYLFTVADAHGLKTEVVLVPCDEGVQAWHNTCTHEEFRLDHGSGITYRQGEIVCTKHGSTFDSCSGYCDNGDAADSTLPSIEVECRDAEVLLVDDGYTFLHEGRVDADDGDELPESTGGVGF